MPQEFPGFDKDAQTPDGGVTSSAMETARTHLEGAGVLAEQIRAKILRIENQEVQKDLIEALDSVVEKMEGVNTSAPSADTNFAERALNTLNILRNFEREVDETLSQQPQSS
jgi:hypothetical protein